MKVENRVTRATAIVEDGRPPWIACELELDSGDGPRTVTVRMTPAMAFPIADALARHALRLDPAIADSLRERVAIDRLEELGAAKQNGAL